MFSYRPKVSDLHLERPRLLDSLPDEGGYAVWLEAPYGYGKSVLASQWAQRLEQDGQRVVWVSASGPAPKALLAREIELPESAPWSVVLQELWREPTLVVLEDLEALEDHESLTPLLEDLRGLVLLASRGPLSSSALTELQRSGRLVHLTGDALAFDEQEAEALYGGSARAYDVWRRTHGWPLPLHFALLTGEMPERTGLLAGMRESLPEPEWSEALLLATVTLLPGSAAVPATERLARSGFAQPTQGGYRLHSMVSEAILRSYGDEARAVLQREQQRLPLVERADAFERSSHLEGLNQVLELVGEQLWRLAPEGVIRWDSLLSTPPSALRHISVGGALKVLGRHTESAERLKLALASGPLSADQQLLALGELCWVQAVTEPGMALQTVERGEALLDQADAERAGRFLTNTFFVDIMAGRFDNAIGRLERALEYLPLASQYRVGARINLALCRWDQRGEFHERLRTQVETLPDVWRLYPSDAPGQCRDVAMLHGWLGDAITAREYFEKARAGARFNPLVGLEVEAALARLDSDPEPFYGLLTRAAEWGDSYTQEIITMHGVETLRVNPGAAQRFYRRSAEQGGLAAAAYALVLADLGEHQAAVSLLDGALAANADRPRQLYLRAARYRVTRSAADLESFIELTTAGAELLPGFVPLNELPSDRPDLTLNYPLDVVAASGWTEAAALRAAEFPELQLRLLGEVSLRHFGQEVRLTERQQQLILLFALGLPRDAAGEAMWPEADTEKRRNNLGVQLSLLRRELEPSGLRTYVFEDGLQRVRSDYVDLKSALDQGDARTVFELYQEPFAPGHLLEPVEEERRTLRAEVVRSLFGAAVKGSVPDPALFLNRVLQIDPLHEEALQRLLTALLEQGRRQEAFRRYKEFQRRLQDELGLEPLAETAALLHAAS